MRFTGKTGDQEKRKLRYVAVKALYALSEQKGNELIFVVNFCSARDGSK